jgi:hypothetical protein
MSLFIAAVHKRPTLTRGSSGVFGALYSANKASQSATRFVSRFHTLQPHKMAATTSTPAAPTEVRREIPKKLCILCDGKSRYIKPPISKS